MRIGIDARLYGPKKQKGLGRYVQELIKGLEKINSDDEFVVFLRQQNWNEYQPQNSRFKKVLADYKWYGLSEQILFSFKIWQNKIDLMHFPHFNAPIFCPIKFVMTIHDLILKKFPSQRASTLAPVLYKIKYLGYTFNIWLAVKRAQKIIAVSEFTKKDILEHFNVSKNKIEVIYNGISVAARPAHNDTLKKHNITKPYLLYVGNAYPHKNLEKLILAFDKIIKKYPDLKLVLVGELDYFYKQLQDVVHCSHLSQSVIPRFNRGIQTVKNSLGHIDSPIKSGNDRDGCGGIQRNIVFTNFVSDEELAELYKNACLYVFPSLYEGFGLPPLEAMSHNLPVACSNAGCLPEILGNAVLYFDPKDIDNMIDKILQAINSSEIREKLILRGQQRIKQYNWQKMAEETVEKIYKQSF